MMGDEKPLAFSRSPLARFLYWSDDSKTWHSTFSLFASSSFASLRETSA
jgi:hypothetical protein